MGMAGLGAGIKAGKQQFLVGRRQQSSGIPGADAVCSHRPPVPKMPETAALPTRSRPTAGKERPGWGAWQLLQLLLSLPVPPSLAQPSCGKSPQFPQAQQGLLWDAQNELRLHKHVPVIVAFLQPSRHG